jgi:YjbE family integral membrane protein
VDLLDTSFLAALAQIMLVNIVLSGDNAVVIALAARNLPAELQKKAILFGSGGAIVLRIALTVVAVEILKIPFLQGIGGLLLVWIALQLLIEEDDEGEAHHSHSDLKGAIKTILIADVVMSLDNTLAIAGVAKGDWTLLITGLALSIPLIVVGSTLIMKIMDRFPIIITLGAGLLGLLAGGMLVDDPAIKDSIQDALGDAKLAFEAIGVAIVILVGTYMKKRNSHKEA